MKHTPIHSFDWRTERCAECGGSGTRWGCDREIECFDCGGEGEWNASCAECGEERKLSTDGLCSQCLGLVEIEVLQGGGIIA